MVLHLRERLMACSNEESLMIADLVSLLHTYCMLVFNSVSGSERRLECQVRRHEEDERRCVRLDDSPRRPAEPASQIGYILHVCFQFCCRSRKPSRVPGQTTRRV